MPLSLTNPTAQVAVSAVDPEVITIDLKNGIVSVLAAINDAQGNLLRHESKSMRPAATTAITNAAKTAVYNELQALYGAGTVT